MADENYADTKSLTNYLCQAYLLPLLLDEDLPQIGHYAPRWPRIQALDMDQPRLIKTVSEIPLPALQNAIRIYFDGFEGKLRVDWNSPHLKLPCPGLTMLSRSAMSRLHVTSEEDFNDTLDKTILCTTAEALRTIERRPRDVDVLNFRRIRVASARDPSQKLWTVHTFGPQIVPTGPVRPGIAIVSIPPWTLGLGDLIEFSQRRKFVGNEFQKDRAGKHAWTNATKVWGMVYDSCRVSAYRWFVVTTYHHWVFGTWSEDWSGAEVTEPIPFDRTRGMSVIEILTFWIECSRDKCRYWQISANALGN